MTEEQRFKIRANLSYDWTGRFSFEDDKRELVNYVVLEVEKEQERIKGLSWYKRLLKKYNR